MFAFILMQVTTLVVYFSEAYVDYTWAPQIWFTSLTIAFTFLVIVVTIDNLMRIASMLESKENKNKHTCFRILGALCVAT